MSDVSLPITLSSQQSTMSIMAHLSSIRCSRELFHSVFLFDIKHRIKTASPTAPFAFKNNIENCSTQYYCFSNCRDEIL